MAPMAGITDLPFRLLAKEGGAGLVCTEMISAKALTHNDTKTKKLMLVSEHEHPVSVQLFGPDPETLSESARIAQDSGADIIDINFGCPVRKIIKSGAGFKLTEQEQRMVDIMISVVRSTTLPVTIKIRIGKEIGQNIAPRLVKLAEQAGIKMVTVHGRPAVSGHSGKPDLEAIAEAVQSTTIPVVGNGGVNDENGAAEFLKATGCAGLMIGRAAIGDPELFKRIDTYLATGKTMPQPPWEQRVESLKKHAFLAAEYYGEQRGLIHMRKIAAYYLKGLPNSASIRDGFNRITTLGQLEQLLASIWQSPYFLEAASGD